MLEPKVWQLTAGSTVLGLLLAAGAVAMAGPWDSGQRKAERAWATARNSTGGAHHEADGERKPEPAPSAAGVLPPVGAPVTSLATSTDLTPALERLLDTPGLGPAPAASVVDVATGDQVYGKRAGQSMTPASTIKIATAVAALSALGPDHRIATEVVISGDGKRLTLVGGGDATLDRKDLRSLAQDSARALRDRGVGKVGVTFDISLYSGPREHPIGPNDNIAPVTALMAGQGRLDTSEQGPAPRSGDPAGDAAGAFADLLSERGIAISGSPAAGRAPKDADRIAVSFSRPVSVLVEQMLTTSDNDLAESLARQTAIEAGEPAGFTGAQQAVQAELKKMKLPVDGALLRDGSGLDRRDRMTAGLLTALLARAADPDRPELRTVLTGLPVAGFSGTLQGRYADAATGTGLIRAKTGTLTGVNTLAGTVVAKDGRLLAFAFLSESAPAAETAQRALDHLSAELAY